MNVVHFSRATRHAQAHNLALVVANTGIAGVGTCTARAIIAILELVLNERYSSVLVPRLLLAEVFRLNPCARALGVTSTPTWAGIAREGRITICIILSCIMVPHSYYHQSTTEHERRPMHRAAQRDFAPRLG